MMQEIDQRAEFDNGDHCSDGIKQPDYEKCGLELRCGCIRTRRYTFKNFEIFNNPKGALFFLCLASFLQGSVISGFYNISVSTIEKRFSLRSSETGFISSACDIAGSFAIPVFTYIGGAGHKPLWTGSGVFIMGLGSLFLSIPHFAAPVYSIDNLANFDCATQEACGEIDLRVYRFSFIIGQMLLGIGSTPLYTLALAYLDENVEQALSSTYHGIFYASSLLGPGVGYLLGGYFLTHFTTMEDPEGIVPENPLWIGNWWLGFLLVGILLIVICLPISMYPEQMPGTDRCRQNRENELHYHKSTAKVKGDTRFGRSIRDAPRSLAIFVKNPTVMIISFANALDSGMMIGVATFGPKYVESMFTVSASDAAFYFGLIAIGTASSAHVICGVLITRFKLSVPQMLKMSVACATTALCFLTAFYISCDNADVAGVFVNDSKGKCEIEMECGCATNLYRPVCGSDNVTYLSFCSADCIIDTFGNLVNCSMVGGSQSTATDGPCQHETCPKLGTFLAVVSLAVFFTFMKGQTTLQWLIIRLAGSVPLPIVFGKVIDMSCVTWGLHCGECGSCHIYDNHLMATLMGSLALSLKGVNVLLLILANVCYKPPPVEGSVSFDGRDDLALLKHSSMSRSLPSITSA